MSPAPAAPRIASVDRMADDVAIRMAERAALRRDRDAAEDERPALDQPVQVVAGADACLRRPPSR